MKELSVFGFRASVDKTLLVIVLLGVIVRLALLVNVYASGSLAPLMYGDTRGYFELAENLAAGHGFVSTQGSVQAPEFFRAPGFPFLLAPFFAGVPLALYPIILATCSGILLPLLTFLIARRVVNRPAALVAAGLAAFEPNLITFSLAFLTEMPCLLLLLGGIELTLRSLEQSRWRSAVMAGVLFAAALYLRPALLPIFFTVMLGVLGILLLRRRMNARIVFVVVLITYAVLVPWHLRTYALTHVYAFSGSGWRNVYTDLLVSLRSIDNKTSFKTEALSQDANTSPGFTTYDINNPTQSDSLRSVSLAEIRERFPTFLKVETLAFISFFLNDNYYYLASRFLLIPSYKSSTHISASHTLLTRGVAGFPAIVSEMRRQYFIPLFGRVTTALLTLAALIGYFRIRHPLRHVFLAAILITAFASSILALSIEARFRIPVMPFLFMLAAPVLLFWWRRLARRIIPA